MNVTQAALTAVDAHWAVKAIGEARVANAFHLSRRRLVHAAVGASLGVADIAASGLDTIAQVALAYEVAAAEGIDLILRDSPDQEQRALAHAAAFRAYELRRVLPLPTQHRERIFHVLHLASLAYCADRWSDVRRWLRENKEAGQVPPISNSWDERILTRLFDGWIRLIRKNAWSDIDAIAPLIVELRREQEHFEASFLQSAPEAAAPHAFRLIALYHWAQATEQLATYMLQGEPRGIATELDQHFEAAREAALHGGDHLLDVILRWLHVASRLMVAGSLWWVAHAINSRATRFVEQVTKARALFELLPPQRAAIQREGLLDPASRAVVVNLPTSGGKTVLAQFRILQALNQFNEDEGWVAYVAPTRALVAQLTRRLRKDFAPLGINVEQLTSAVDIDGFESQLLSSTTASSSFHVIVSTPEKLSIVLRNKATTRPLALLVLDEAHNIEDPSRGLRIELLLATAKRECPDSSFLLLMPFVPNAEDLARWLDPTSGRSIGLSTSAWQPNERIVGMYSVKKEPGRGNWSLTFDTLTTSLNTMHLAGSHKVDGVRPLPIPFSTAKAMNYATGAMARVFSERGTSIAVARTIPDAWNAARAIVADGGLPRLVSLPDSIALVQRFLATEVSPHFELITMLAHGVAVHHAGLSDESRALIEWLAEEGDLKVLCATTTIAQGINFPVASVFLASLHFAGVPPTPMSPRAFWNLAGRAGRIDHDNVGVVGIAAGADPQAVRRFVKIQTEALVSRLVGLLNDAESSGRLAQLDQLIYSEDWDDFRVHIAHLLNEAGRLDTLIAEAEQVLRNTFGFSELQRNRDALSQRKAKALLDATRTYASKLDRAHSTLADSTGFSPEGVRSALGMLSGLERKLTVQDWSASSLFGQA